MLDKFFNPRSVAVVGASREVGKDLEKQLFNSAMISGMRGEKSVDMQLVAECIQRISQLSMDFPQIEEMDINPLKISAEGASAVAVDARIRILQNPSPL